MNKDDHTTVKKYGRWPTLSGIFMMIGVSVLTYKCVTQDGAFYRMGNWVSWQSWMPIIILGWFCGITSLAFGIRRIFREMALSTTLDSGTDNTQDDAGHRTG